VTGLRLNTTPPHDVQEVSLLGIINAMLRQRRLVLAFALGLPLLVGLATILRRATYTTSAAFVPQGRRNNTNLAGLAAQFGLAVPGADASQSPQFYADLMRSRPMLAALVDATYDVATDTGRARGTLVTILDTDGPTPALRREDGITLLGRMVSVNPQPKTAVVRFTVTSENAELSQQIGARMLSEINRFNLATRTSQATAERKFTEKRLADSRAELARAEEDLRGFQQGNRGFGGAPGLALQQERLQREVTLRQQIYSTLAQAYEQARIEEVRDTPVLSVLEEPYVPVRRDPRGLVTKVLGALIAGTVVGVLLALVRDRMRRQRSVDDEVAEFAELRRQTVADLRAPWRLLRPARARATYPA
jgi:uncharacterized protein involved in exopolysaccharide biosynthesis